MIELIQTTLENATDDLRKLPYSDDCWTRFIMNLLSKLGQEKGYYVCATKADQANRNRGEWLYDMTWIKYDGTHPIDVGLVLECEWNTGPEEADRKFDKIEYDFQKLLLTRAELRCLICWPSTRQNAIDTIQSLIDQVQQFQKSECGDNYLFCVWRADKRLFEFCTYTYHPAEEN